MSDHIGNIVAKDRLLYKKACQYIGSIACSQFTKNDRQAFVNERLYEMKDVRKGIPVVMQITEEGVKILQENEKSVKMAHGITRLAFTTSHPEHRLFAYVGKSMTVNNDVTIQAHMFKLKKYSHAEQVSQFFSKAFEIAYAKDTVKRKERVKLFENEALESKAQSQKTKRGNKWAKLEMSRGHENAGHARKAVGFTSPSEFSRFKHEFEKDAPNDPALMKQVKNNMRSPVENRPPMPIPEDQPNTPLPKKVLQEKSYMKRTKSSPVYTEIIDPPSFSQPHHQQAMHQKIIKAQSTPSFDVKDDHSISMSNIDNAKEQEHFANNRSNHQNQMLKQSQRSVSFSTKNEMKRNFIEKIIENEEEVYLYPTGDLPKIPQQRINTKDRNGNFISITTNKKPIARPQSMSALDYTRPTPLFLSGYDDDLFDTPFINDNEYQNVSHHKRSGYDNVSTNEILLNSNDDNEYYDNAKAQEFLLMKEDDILKSSEWYQPGISREIAEEHVKLKPTGTFLIRSSQSSPGSFVLTVAVPEAYKSTKIANFLIEKSKEYDYRIKGYKPCFKQLTDLIAHYSSFCEDIPCKLLLKANSPIYFRKLHIDQPDSSLKVDEPDNLTVDLMNDSIAEEQKTEDVFETDYVDIKAEIVHTTTEILNDNDCDDDDGWDDDEWDDDHDYQDIDFQKRTSVDDIMKELDELTFSHHQILS